MMTFKDRPAQIVKLEPHVRSFSYLLETPEERFEIEWPPTLETTKFSAVT